MDKTSKCLELSFPSLDVSQSTEKKLYNVTNEANISLKDRKIVFSMLFFDRSTQLFNLSKVNENWFIGLMDRLKVICDMKVSDFVRGTLGKGTFDVHPHDWSQHDKTKYYPTLPKGLFEQIEEDCWQFRFSKSQGRIHGFLISATFYIVWLDYHHNFNPDDKFGGEKYYDYPLTEYQKLEIENEELIAKVKKLEEDLNQSFVMLEKIEQEKLALR